MKTIKKLINPYKSGMVAFKQPSANNNSTRESLKSAVKAAFLLFLSFSSNGYAIDRHTQAKQAVLNQPCLAGETVGQLLNHKHRTLHTDLGWRVFALEQGDFLVERAFLVSKSAELNYRWRVGASDAPQPMSERAKNLCSS